MNSKERVLSAFFRKGYDRIPVKHEGTPEINQMIIDHFGLKNDEQLLKVVGDDFRYAEPVYIGPELRRFPDGSVEGYFGERYIYKTFDGGRYLESCYQPYAGVKKLEDLDRSHFPSAEWFDYSSIKRQCREKSQYAVCFGDAGNLDFINGISRAKGMEDVLMGLMDEDPALMALIEARFRFYYDTQERALQAADGLIDFCHIGEDLGSQIGPMISMKVFEKHFAPRFGKFFEMAHSYGAKVLMHMCGCVYRFLPRLIELGLDVYDVVQPTTPEMDIANLQKEFGSKLCFSGTMCVQTTLAHGSAQEVKEQVKRRLKLFPKGGLFLGPTHAVQVGSPLENVLAMYRTAGSLCEKIDDSILDLGQEGPGRRRGMSKLY